MKVCRNGHSKEFSRISPSGKSICRPCERDGRNRYYNKHKEVRSKINALNDRKLRGQKRKAILEFLGNVCVKCGFTDVRALQIDHKYGGGSKESKIIKAIGTRYKRIYTHPELYQLLCANCNAIKVWENNERITIY